MNWSPEPATERQLTYLKRLGYAADHIPNRGEAAQLIRQLQDQQTARLYQHAQSLVEHEPHQLHQKVERVRASGAGLNQNDLAEATAERQEFWSDTCRDVSQMHLKSKRVLELYKKHGCRFEVPSHAHVQSILDALDVAAPNWDLDHPELFYQTLELNHPELLRHF